MSRQILMTEKLYQYMRDVSLRETDLHRRLREETEKTGHISMQISPEQGQFMALLAKIAGVRRYLEIGVFTGSSSLWIAAAIPAEGRIVACDKDETWTTIAQRYWQEAGVAHKIDLRLGLARTTLDQLVGNGHSGSFDMAFLDADKENYDGYYESCLLLIRAGGLILIDNTFWGGAVINPEANDPPTTSIRALNQKIHEDERVDASFLPIGDGLILVRKR